MAGSKNSRRPTRDHPHHESSGNGKEATRQEAEVLQTYLVGTKQILEERDLWIPPVGSEVMVLENTGTLVRKTPEEVKALVQSGIYIEIIPGKLLCSRKAPCGRRKARIVGCGKFWHT